MIFGICEHFHAGDATAAIPVEPDDVIGPDEVERVLHMLHHVLEGRTRHRVGLLQRLHVARGLRHRGGSFRRRHLRHAVQLDEDRAHRFLAIGIFRRGDEIGAERVDLDAAADLGQNVQPPVVYVARMIVRLGSRNATG